MDKEADICLVTEGSYPYNYGGVAEWVHKLIIEHKERTFHILTLMPPDPELIMRYQFPENVIGHTTYIVQVLPQGSYPYRSPKGIWDTIGPTLDGMMSSKEFNNFAPMLMFFRKHHRILGKRILSESHEFWNFLIKMYNEIIPSGPFKSYFATIYTLSRSFFSVTLPELPQAKIFHAVCTGYAGFMLHRAKVEKNASCILTEHGIYSNERRIEIAMSNWITEVGSLDLALEDKKKSLKDFWLNAFFSMAHACYKSSDEVITTYDGNQEIQIEGGADPKKVRTIVHGISQKEISILEQPAREHPKTVAFIGRCVPIKDVKSFIRACHIINNRLPNIRFYILGPTEEDPDYFSECQQLIEFLGLTNQIKFFGKVKLCDYVTEIDVIALTSLSEAQPLVILEMGGVGIPFVATNVGACKQLLEGGKDELPPLGPGGIITPLANPEATAEAIIKLLTDRVFYQQCSEVIKQRIRKYYSFEKQHEEYRKIYQKYLDLQQNKKE